ncbi:MAG: dihydropteroate synthase-like protein [Promethearchaeota archaeon]
MVKSISKHEISIFKAPITISAFLTENITSQILEKVIISNYDLILIPGFVQWDTFKIEKKFSIQIRKGPEFASDLPEIIENLDEIELSTNIPANKLFEESGENKYYQLLKKQIEQAKNETCHHTFYIREDKSDLIIGKNLPPPIIAEIVNCPEKTNSKILKKTKHYIASGAEIIDIGCVSNRPDPERVKQIINIIRSEYNVLVSIDSMDQKELKAAIDEDIDLVLSLDLGSYKEFLDIPKDIPIVILPTNLKKAFFPKAPEVRIRNLFKLTKELQKNGFQKIIADPLLETPITPGICNSLDSYFLYKKQIELEKYRELEVPLFFGISNVVELIDIDSVGINGLLASIAAELDIGILFTVEHSPKLFGGVRELKDSIKLSYLAKYKNTPPINQGLSLFRAKGKINQNMPSIKEDNAIIVDDLNPDYKADEKGYFRFFLNQNQRKIYALFYSNKGILLHTFIGENAEALSKKIIKQEIIFDLYHLNYLGRELKKAEICLLLGKPYIQDE